MSMENVIVLLHTPPLQVGLVSYSTGATIEFDLNDFQTMDDVIEAFGEVVYTRGWTATALALGLTRFMMDPELDYGARPFSNGIPKVAVLITDGRSNQLPITDRANALRDFGVQVYCKLVFKCMHPQTIPLKLVVCRFTLLVLPISTYLS